MARVYFMAKNYKSEFHKVGVLRFAMLSDIFYGEVFYHIIGIINSGLHEHGDFPYADLVHNIPDIKQAKKILIEAGKILEDKSNQEVILSVEKIGDRYQIVKEITEGRMRQ